MGDTLNDLAGIAYVPPNGYTLTFKKTEDILQADNLAAGRNPWQRLSADRQSSVDRESVTLTQDDLYLPNGSPRTPTAVMAKLRAKMRSKATHTPRPQNPGSPPNAPVAYPRFSLHVHDTGIPFASEWTFGDAP